MIRTKGTHSLALAGFAPAGKLDHPYRCLLPVLALCLATAAWSQTARPVRGGRVAPYSSGGVQRPKPAPVTEASAQYQFITIEIPGAGTCGYNACNQAFGINNARLVTGYYTDTSGISHGFAWQNGVAHSLDYPGAADTYLYLDSNRGVVIGYYENAAGADTTITYSFPSGAWAVLPDVTGYPNNIGSGINDSGFAVGNAYSADFSASAAWIWDPSTQSYSFFVVPGSAGNSTDAYAINDKGLVVGQFTDGSGVTHGFLKDGGTYTTIDPPDSTYAYADAINSSGTIVGPWTNLDGWSEGFIRSSDGTITVLDVPGALETQIYGINDRGDICGVAVNAVTGQWTPFVAFRK